MKDHNQIEPQDHIVVTEIRLENKEKVSFCVTVQLPLLGGKEGKK